MRKGLEAADNRSISASSSTSDHEQDEGIDLLASSRSDTMAAGRGRPSGPRRKHQQQQSSRLHPKIALLSLLAAAPRAMAQNCIALTGSTQCPAFESSSISTDSTLVGYFPFLASVNTTAQFDEQLSAYVATSYVSQKYQTLLGCGGINLTNTTNLYARYTTTVICNSIVQNSKTPCALSDANSKPVCAETCAAQAESESMIIADSSLCTDPSTDAASLIRADFTNCALPANALSGTCIDGSTNEVDNCGYGTSTIGFCQYCATGGQNSTDTCCYNSGAESRCAGVVLPTITGYITFPTSTSSASSTTSPTSSSSASSTPTGAAASTSDKGLSKGAIAGIAIGAVALGALIIALIVLALCCFKRRRRGSQNGSVFNQPSPARRKPGPGSQGMAYNPVGASSTTPAGYEVLPGGRIARMSALEGHSGDSPPRSGLGTAAGAAAAGAAGGYASRRGRHHDHSSSSEFGDSPVSSNQGVLRPPPAAGRRHGSLSSTSALGEGDPQSPLSGSHGGMSSPPGVSSQQSEQLPFFKDYYSHDEIHPGDKVATLWAYQPRAGDEFALERGDMLKVVGIWDDGWATGVLMDEKADEWDARRSAQRDSGVSNTSGRREESPATSGEIKAFPLVCVCVPDHWKKTIEGDGSTETGSTAPDLSGAR